MYVHHTPYTPFYISSWICVYNLKKIKNEKREGEKRPEEKKKEKKRKKGTLY